MDVHVLYASQLFLLISTQDLLLALSLNADSVVRSNINILLLFSHLPCFCCQTNTELFYLKMSHFIHSYLLFLCNCLWYLLAISDGKYLYTNVFFVYIPKNINLCAANIHSRHTKLLLHTNNIWRNIKYITQNSCRYISTFQKIAESQKNIFKCIFWEHDLKMQNLIGVKLLILYFG